MHLRCRRHGRVCGRRLLTTGHTIIRLSNCQALVVAIAIAEGRLVAAVPWKIESNHQELIIVCQQTFSISFGVGISSTLVRIKHIVQQLVVSSSCDGGISTEFSPQALRNNHEPITIIESPTHPEYVLQAVFSCEN